MTHQRKFLNIVCAASMLAAILIGCTPQVVKETVVVSQTVIVEKPIEKVVKETVIVEGTPQVLEKVVTATPVPTEEPRIGIELIGDLEGPEVITDPAEFPQTFQEAPQLAALVEAGKLPPVAERIGEDPLVIRPTHEIGKYGGTMRRGFTGPSDKWNPARMNSLDTVLWWSYNADKIVPNIAKDWEVSDDGKELILHLRKGMKWSDGYPFTADDFLFWFEDMNLNDDITPTTAAEMTINAQPVIMEKVDEYTVKYIFPAPYYMFPEMLAGYNKTQGEGHSKGGDLGRGGFAPAHYLKQFHPNYVAEDELDRKVKEAGFDNWLKLFLFKNDSFLNTELPVVTPWKMVTPINTLYLTYERNPYSIWVDTEGNQLPYVDNLVFELAENLEVLNLRAIAGEYDIQARHIDAAKLPVLLQNQEKGGYKVHLDTGAYGSDAGLNINQSYDADPEIAKWLNTADFRRALSLGIDRDELNEVFWLGLGTPGSAAPVDGNRFSPGPEYRTLWSTHDPEKANALLDQIGLEEKDADGYRLRTDGGGRLKIELLTYAGQMMPFSQMGEMVKEDWQDIGIWADVKDVERSLGYQLIQSNDFHTLMWANDGTEDLFTSRKILPIDSGVWAALGPIYGRWYATGGTDGKEPPAPMARAMELFRKAPGVPDDERVQLGKEIWSITLDEVFYISFVGLSPASSGIRIANTNLGNVPARQLNSIFVRTPGISCPPTFFWKE